MLYVPKLNNYYTETYRSGHNELDSKSSCPQGHVGSNPTVSATKPWNHCISGLSYFYSWCPSPRIFAKWCPNVLHRGAHSGFPHAYYARKMYSVVPKCCPTLLRTYKKWFSVIKRYSYDRLKTLRRIGCCCRGTPLSKTVDANPPTWRQWLGLAARGQYISQYDF